MKYLLPVLLLFSIVSAHAHLNRTEKPKSFVFIFQNKDTLQFSTPTDSLLNAYSLYIVENRKRLTEARLTFKDGETITFTANKKKWTSIKVSDGNHDIAMPDSALQKITEINFATVAIVWSGSEGRPFGTGYFYIRFDTGRGKELKEYSLLKLIITNYQFSKFTIGQSKEKGEHSHN